MFRRGFFLALVGAVAAKAQQRSAPVEIQSNLDPKDLKPPKPRSGYCGVCGTKGEFRGMIYGKTWPDSTTADGMEIETKLLRCPHCGTLFTETETE